MIGLAALIRALTPVCGVSVLSLVAGRGPYIRHDIPDEACWNIAAAGTIFHQVGLKQGKFILFEAN
jgi:hypothetical protein